MSNVQPITPQHRRIEAPTVLRALQAWILWRYEQFPGEQKPRKIPYYADGGKRYGLNGNPKDRERLVTFAAARDAAAKRGMDGVGFCPLPEFNVTATDFDNCVDAAGNVPDEIGQIATRTYAEYSPSGNGVRAFSVGNFDNRKAKSTADQYGFETFSNSGFVTFTGNVLPVCEMFGCEDTVSADPVVADIIQRLCDTRFGPRTDETIPDDFTLGHAPKLGLTIAQMEHILTFVDPDCGRDEWIRVGHALHHECEGDDTGFDLWDEWSQPGATYPGTEGLRQQWESFERRAGERRRQVTMASVIHMAKKNGYVHKRPSEGVDHEEVLARVEAAKAEPAGPKGRFAACQISELSNRKPAGWHIKGILPDGSVCMIYGASGSGKTFVVMDFAFHIARGLPWRGRKVRQGAVAIIAAEGAGGLWNRARATAIVQEADLASLPIYVITAAPNFLDQEDITEVLAELALIPDLSVVFIDTLAQVTPGANENTSEDMGRAVANVNLIHAATGASAALVHHAGKDINRGSRGWSGMKGAMEAQIEVIRHENGQREIHLEKMKDGEDGLRFGFELKTIELGVDEDGDIISSCAVVEADLPSTTATVKERKDVVRYGANERHVLEVIESEYAAVNDVAEALFVARCAELLAPPDPGKRDQRLFLMRRAVQSLAKRKDGPLALQHGRVIFCT